MADDWTNIVPENASVNRARGAEIMTPDEMIDAEINAEMVALDIDGRHFGDDPEFMGELIDAGACIIRPI